MARTIIFMRGLPGSGKSTWAKAWAEAEPTKRIRVAKDDIRRMFGVYWVPDRERFVNDTWSHIIKYALSDGYDVVVDDMNLQLEDVNCSFDLVDNDMHLYDVLAFCRRTNTDIVIEDFITPPSVCTELDERRPGTQRIGHEVINERAEIYRHTVDIIINAGKSEHVHMLDIVDDKVSRLDDMPAISKFASIADWV